MTYFIPKKTAYSVVHGSKSFDWLRNVLTAETNTSVSEDAYKILP